MVDVAIRRLGAEGVAAVEPLYRELHRHHLEIARVPVVRDPDLSWARRRQWYADKLAAGAVLLLAEAGQTPVGYALLELHRGPDDTWPVGEHYAELVSLVVSRDRRGQGIGGRLMAAVDAELEQAGVADLMVGVLDGNDEAVRFYARHGLAVGELVMWRFGSRAAAGGAVR